jgi:CBS domain-containing protein
MLSVRDLMTPDVVTVDPALSLRDVVDLLVANGITGAAVIQGDRVLGTISANDILSFESSIPGVPTEREDVVGLDEDPPDPDSAPASYFADYWDDAGADVAERFAQVGSPEWDLLSEHTVSEAMSRDILAMPPEAAVQEAAEFMRATGVHRVLVVEHDRLVGIVTTMDITRAVAEYRLSEPAESAPEAAAS